jgi:hypothetical protein
VGGPGAEQLQVLVEVELESLRARGAGGEGVIRVSYDALQQHGAGFGYRSFVGTAHFDCQRRSISISSAAYYALPGAGGARVGTDSSGRQSGMPPGLVSSIPAATRQALLRATCATTQAPS